MGGEIGLLIAAVLVILTIVAGCFEFDAHRVLSYPVHRWRMRRFARETWDPLIEGIGHQLEEVFDPDVLDDTPTVRAKIGDGRPMHSTKRLIHYVSEDEVRNRDVGHDTLVSVTKRVTVARTEPFRLYLPRQLKQAIDTVAIAEVVWEVEESAMEEADMAAEEENVDPITEQKVREMHAAGALVPFVRDVLAECQNQRPDGRIRDRMGRLFEERYKRLQKTIRALVLQVSNRQLEYHEQGLKGVFAPGPIETPSSYADWHMFFWTHREGVAAYAQVDGIKNGDFEGLWKQHAKTLFQIEGMTQDEVYKLVSDWVRGLGGKKGRRKKRVTEGTPVEVALVFIEDLRHFSHPVTPKEYRHLTGTRLTYFGKLTQKQMNALLRHRSE